MNNIVAEFEKEQMEILSKDKSYPEFHVGDLVRVRVKIGERFQNYEGICIAMRKRGYNSSFTVRKISYGEGVERVFPFHSPNVAEVTLLKRGKVRRAKLYYLRDRSGKSAKIAEDTTGIKAKLTKLDSQNQKAEKLRLQQEALKHKQEVEESKVSQTNEEQAVESEDQAK